jgi:spermidine/putrescine transport system ATP-binding protein
VDVVIRPEDLELRSAEEGLFPGQVLSVLFKGAYYEIKVRTGDYIWTSQSVNAPQAGACVGLYVLPDNIQIMHKPKSEDAEVIKE